MALQTGKEPVPCCIAYHWQSYRSELIENKSIQSISKIQPIINSDFQSYAQQDAQLLLKQIYEYLAKYTTVSI